MLEQHYIQDQDSLESFVAQIKQQEWICLDTEFLRTKTYYPKLCLLQIAIPGHLVIVDVLQNDLNLSELYAELMQHTLVMHACRQDLEVLFIQCKQLPSSVFDTQLVAAFLGFRDQIGYGNLVEDLTQVKLQKSHTRTNWEQRPLTTGQLEYAFDDVRYLLQIYPILLEQLKQQEKHDWYLQEMQSMLKEEWICGDPNLAWERVRGLKNLRAKQRSVASALAVWREQTAQTANRPRNWILKDEDLLSLAKKQPKTTEELGKIVKSLNNPNYQQAIIERIQQANQAPPLEIPLSPMLSDEQKDLVDTLSIAVRLIAQQHQLQSNLLASRKHLEKLVRQPGHGVFHGWREKVLTERLYGLLDGKYVLKIEDRKAKLSKISQSPK